MVRHCALSIDEENKTKIWIFASQGVPRVGGGREDDSNPALALLSPVCWCSTCEHTRRIGKSIREPRYLYIYLYLLLQYV